MHPAIVIIRSIIETSGDWDEAEDAFIRHQEAQGEWLIAELDQKDLDTRNDVRQAFQLQELTFLEILKLKEIGCPFDLAEKIDVAAKNYFKTHPVTEDPK